MCSDAHVECSWRAVPRFIHAVWMDFPLWKLNKLPGIRLDRNERGWTSFCICSLHASVHIHMHVYKSLDAALVSILPISFAPYLTVLERCQPLDAKQSICFNLFALLAVATSQQPNTVRKHLQALKVIVDAKLKCIYWRCCFEKRLLYCRFISRPSQATKNFEL